MLTLSAAAQRHDVRGSVEVQNRQKPIGGAIVELPEYGLWAVADSKGRFVLKNVPEGKTQFVVSHLGFVTTATEATVPAEGDLLRLYAPEKNLLLDNVEVTAVKSPDRMSTSRTIDAQALDHLQMMNVSDISSLLPGGKTVNPNLTEDNRFALRAGRTAVDNAAFGTAVEVDGVRLSTNASPRGMNGASTRNISSTNIESIEVVTGVPSAEYGDLGSGLVRISTRKGKTPYLVTLATNPYTKQAALSKGFELRSGVLNSSVEYARSTQNPASPYTSYSRTGLALNYQTVQANALRFNIGVTGNIGGMDSKNDPDAQKGEWEKAHDNALRVNTSLQWLLNRKGITNIDFDASINYQDNLVRKRTHPVTGAVTAAPHATEQGYFITDVLPSNYVTTQHIDSKQLDYAVALKAMWIRSWGRVHSNAKVGAAWRAEGNVGQGEYYDDPTLSPKGYRPRPYADIPYMHNLAFYIEELLTLPLGSGSLNLMAGLRAEKTFIANSQYDNAHSFSPRLNLRYRIADWITVRGGWGLATKLPSFETLYPALDYRDYSSFESTYPGGQVYVYYTQPYSMLHNPQLQWQRNRNAEVALDLNLGGTSLSVVGFFNRTSFPYRLLQSYDPFSYRTSKLPANFTMPANPLFRVDAESGTVFVGDGNNPSATWVPMETKAENQTFVTNVRQGNGSPIDRKGVELVMKFPQINPIRTQLYLDGAYTYVRQVNTGERWNYPSVMTGDRYYPYVGIYPEINDPGTSNGSKEHTFTANLTATTRLPSIRMIVSLRLEASFVRWSQNISLYNGAEYAFNVGADGHTPTGGSIYDGDSYTAVWPFAYVGLDGQRHPFTEKEMADPAFASLLLRSTNTYNYNPDSYSPYFSANLNITKEIGNHVSVSLYANNFTNSRPAIRSSAKGTLTIFTPNFYYGLAVRLKF